MDRADFVDPRLWIVSLRSDSVAAESRSRSARFVPSNFAVAGFATPQRSRSVGSTSGTCVRTVTSPAARNFPAGQRTKSGTRWPSS